nr:SDR family oxidoreductase [Pseudomonas sp.]
MKPVKRVVLITGANGGIGRSLAERFAHDGAGIALLDISPRVEELADTLAASGAQVAMACADVADAAQVNEAVRLLETRLGPIDCLINNAGLTGNIAPLARMKTEAWQKELAINLGGPFNLLQAVLPGMVERGWGRIVNISSAAARGGLFNQAGYAATKTGLLGLTRNVTLEYARHGVTCNAILPGLIDTPAVQGMPPIIRDDALSLVPAGRTGQPAEVAALAAFLCSDEAAFINGAEIDIDGGARLCPTILGSVREVQARQERARQHAAP